MVTKFVTADIKSVKDEDQRIIVGKASGNLLDRDKEIIRSSAWTDDGLRHFRANPVLMLSHNYKGLPIGKVRWVKRGTDGLYFEAQLSKGRAETDEAWQIIKEFDLGAFSVGFIPHKSYDVKVNSLMPHEKDSCYSAGLFDDSVIKVHTDVELLEISMVSVPSCPTALLISHKAGKIKTKCLNCTCERMLNDNPSECLNCMSKDIHDDLIPAEAKQTLAYIEKEIRNTRAEIERYRQEKEINRAVNKALSDERIREMIIRAVWAAIEGLKHKLKEAEINEIISKATEDLPSELRPRIKKNLSKTKFIVRR